MNFCTLVNEFLSLLELGSVIHATLSTVQLERVSKCAETESSLQFSRKQAPITAQKPVPVAGN